MWPTFRPGGRGLGGDRDTEKGKEQMIHAECHSDDYVVEVKFDATLWLETASGREIKALRECDWGGDYPADAVAQFMACYDPNVKRLFDYLGIIAGRKEAAGFECHVDRQDAIAWLLGDNEEAEDANPS